MEYSENEISAQFTSLCEEWYKLMQKGEPKAANKIFDILYKGCASLIRELPDKGEMVLTALLDHNSPSVRSKAAYLLLPLNEKRALNALYELSNQKIPWITSSARTTVEEWKKGRLDVDWFTKDRK